MSGNPFRRAQERQVEAEPSFTEEPEPPPPSSRRKKKKVTIQTPPRSPEDPPRRLSAGRLSPPPPLPLPLQEDDEDSTSSTEADAKLREASLNTRRNSDSRPPLPSVPAAPAAGAPYNPFARTLATSEAAYGLQRAGETQENSNRVEDRAGVEKSPLDVDTFKNILLTGSAPPVSSSVAEVPQVSGNDATTSGISLDDLESASSEDDDEYDDGSSHRALPLNPPSAISANDERNGGPSRGPQTVSFSEFSPAIESSFVDLPIQPTVSSPQSPTASKPPMSNRQSSDMNKPLPSTPTAPTVRVPLSPRDITNDSAGDAPGVYGQDESSRKKAPPPPPASRRQAQTTISQNRPRSTSNLTEDSNQEDSSATVKNEKVPPPAPPPSRKARPLSQVPSPAIVTPSETPSPTAETKPLPLPPPRRAHHKSGGSINRSSSNSSHKGLQRASTLPAPPPPAPPRRRGVGANRGAVDDSSDAATRPRDATQRLPSSDSTASNDILADMSAFQAEIDALRAKAQPSG